MSAARRPRTAAAVFILIALPCAFFWRVLFGGQVLLPGEYLAHFEPWKGVLSLQQPVYWNALIWDAMAQYLPWRAFAHRWLAQGVIPLWNPHQFCGTPFVANGQSALFYPLNLLFWLFEPARTFGWAMALHFALAGLFAFAFLRTLGLGRSGALLGGVAFQFCGFFITWAELPTLVNVGIWLPLVFLCIERFFRSHRLAWACAGGAVIGVALLAGHPQMAFYLLLGSGAYFVFRWACDLRDRAGLPAVGVAGWARGLRGLLGGVVALGVAAGLAAVQALPIVEILPYSHRAAGTYQGYLQFAMPWRHLVTIVLPDFFGRPTDGTYWAWPAGNYAELVAYGGIAPLLLAILAVAWWRGSRCPRHVWFFGGMAVIALLAALGTPVNAVLFKLVPGFGRSGGPARMLYLWAASVAFLAGMGADALIGRLHRDDRRAALARDGLLAAAALIVAAVALAPAAWSSVASHLRPTPGLAIDIARPSIVVFAVVVLLWALVIVAATRRAIRPGLLAAGLLAFTAADLFAFGIDYNPTCPPHFIYPETPEIRAAREAGPNSRVMGLRSTWPIGPDFPQAALPPNAATYYGLYDVNGYDSIYLQGYKDALADAIGDDPSPAANGNMVFADVLTYQAAGRFAMGRLISPVRDRVYGPIDDAGRIDGPRRAAAWPFEGRIRYGVVPANVRMISPNAADVTVERRWASASATVHLRDTRVPGWHAAANGQAIVLSPSTGTSWQSWQMTLQPESGRIEFRYEPSTFRFGLFVTLCALGMLAAVGCAVAAQRRRP